MKMNWKINLIVGFFLIISYFILESMKFAAANTEEELAQAAGSNQYLLVFVVGLILVIIGVYRKIKEKD